jgi:cytochrome c oxidase cbb3-type subunit 3
VKHLAAIVLCAAVLVACEREQRRFSEIAPASGSPTSVSGSASPSATGAPVTVSPYAGNAWAVSEGKRLYQSMNCSGCHSQGGGGMGPALMDDHWIYGGDPRSLYVTIVEGRPNGMPAFGGKIADQQIWQLVAYVQSLAGGLRIDVRPSRDDHMQVRESEQARRHEPR